MQSYEWTEGCRFSADANVVGRRLAELMSDTDETTAEAILADAKSPRSPLHSLFEWNNSRAAHEYRLEQARAVIRSVRVVYMDAGIVERQIRLATFIPSRGAYVSQARVLDQKAIRKEALALALRDMEAFERRYQEYVDIAEIGAAARRAIQQALEANT